MKRIIHLPNYDAIDSQNLEAQLTTIINQALKQVAERIAVEPMTRNDLETVKFIYQIIQDKKAGDKSTPTLLEMAKSLRESKAT